ncbi:MAG: sialidase family protein [Pirellulaceae bacterium]
MNRNWIASRLPGLLVIVGLALFSSFGGQESLADDAKPASFQLATFSADVTPPLGHSLLGGTTTPPPAHAIDDPLLARGFVLIGGEKPVVVVSIDWCEIRNDAYDRWREALAAAAGTTRERVLVTAIHQHDAPLADLEAQRILDGSKLGGSVVDPEYHERCVQATVAALRDGLKSARRVTHFGTGQAKVDRIASNRRYIRPDGSPSFDRGSMSGGDALKSRADEGVVDPWLKTLSFWDGDTPLCALHVYAVHPMSNWGSGRVTADFPGAARWRMQEAHPAVFQIYASGCSGDTTAGKYNDGSDVAKRVLQDRLFDAMSASWKSTRRQPLTKLGFHNSPFELPLRTAAGYTEADLRQQLESDNSKNRCLAALALSWRKRHAARQPIDLPVLDFGSAAVALLPGETYVAFQLAAQQMRPNDFIIVIGYGESAPGFVPIEQAWRENDSNLKSWCWVDPGCEPILSAALRRALAPQSVAPAVSQSHAASTPRVLTMRSKTLFQEGEAAPSEHAVYVHPHGAEMMTHHARSADHGQTWRPAQATPDFDSKLRRGFRRVRTAPFVDPVEDRLVTFVLALDVPDLDPNVVEPPIGENEYYLRYRVSLDGGKTYQFDDRIVQRGEFNDRHPIDGVWLGKNGYYLGDAGNIPIRTRAGKLLVPVQIPLLGDDGKLSSPGGGFTYQYTRMLIGTWSDGHKIQWDVSDKIEGDPDRTSRGLFEPTIAELPDGRVICVMRGSNGGSRDKNCEWPAHKWFSESRDGGKTWSKARPWTYADGSELFSPSAMSQLLPYSDGRLFWLGNISEKNCCANNPRYPLVIGQVDPQTGGLMKETVLTLDTLQPDDTEGLNLSHWLAHENRATGRIHIPMRRWNTPYTKFRGVEYVVDVRKQQSADNLPPR